MLNKSATLLDLLRKFLSYPLQESKMQNVYYLNKKDMIERYSQWLSRQYGPRKLIQGQGE